MTLRQTLNTDTLECDYVLPDSHRTLPIKGTADFIKDMREMMKLMVHSPTALKIFNFNAGLPTPTAITEFTEGLDAGRNTGGRIQVVSGKTQTGRSVSKYSWLTLVPHEMRHSYNLP